MITHKTYVAGWLNMTIADVLNNFPRTYKRLEYALITCIDSNKKPASIFEISPELNKLKGVAMPLGQGLILKTSHLLSANKRHAIFYGFDEVWFFPNMVRVEKPDTSWIVGPSRVDAQTFKELGTWMTETSCSLAIGGGAGLNFILKANGLVRHIVGLSVEQPSLDELVSDCEIG